MTLREAFSLVGDAAFGVPGVPKAHGSHTPPARVPGIPPNPGTPRAASPTKDISPPSHRDIMLLLEKATGLDSTTLRLANPETILPEDAKIIFLHKLEQRWQGVPVQYILGEWSFLGLPIKCAAGCLIPRGDTEILAEEALAHLANLKNSADVLDICTGSGCIAVALACFSKDSRVTATDISKDALKIAQENARLNGVTVEFLYCDLFPAGGEFDLIVSNPPYIATGELNSLAELRHEPRLALDGGNDGLDFYRRIIPGAGKFLKPGGAFFLEIGHDQAEAVCRILQECRFKNISVVKDLAGHDRVVKAISGNPNSSCRA